MQPSDDSALLRRYTEDHSDDAFAALVTRHVNLVYSVALRQTGHPQNAEEITQAVFIILAKKAAGLRHEKALSSWLFQAARLTAINFVRGEIRRRHREQEAHMQTILNESGGEVWPKIAPLLDDAVAKLREPERRAIVLRFYEGRNLREVGVALGASEAAAKKRVGRALEKLRRYFAKHGVDSTTTAIAENILAHSIQVAPVALAKGAAASTSTLTLVTGALKVMAWTKAKTTIVAGAALILACGATITIFKKHSAHEKLVAKAYQRANLTDKNYRGIIATLRSSTWPQERQLAEDQIKARQQTDETTHAVTIDLKPYVNAKLTDSSASGVGNHDDNLSELPSGVHIYGGVPFDVEGTVQLDGTNMLALNKHFPAEMDNIRINQKFAKLYLFHGADWIYGHDLGKTVAKLVLHYADGSTNEIEIVAGKHIFDWWLPLFKTGVDPRYFQMADGTEKAWTGSNPLIKRMWPDESLVLYKSTFENPQPDVTVSTVDYVSTKTGTAPFLVGLTVE